MIGIKPGFTPLLGYGSREDADANDRGPSRDRGRSIKTPWSYEKSCDAISQEDRDSEARNESNIPSRIRKLAWVKEIVVKDIVRKDHENDETQVERKNSGHRGADRIQDARVRMMLRRVRS